MGMSSSARCSNTKTSWRGQPRPTRQMRAPLAAISAAMAACRTIARHKVPRLLSFEVLSSTEQAPPYPEFAFLPNFYVDITPFLKQKIAAMKAYSRELKEFPHPRSLGGIEVLAKKRGMEIGFNAAEGFMLIRDEWK